MQFKRRLAKMKALTVAIICIFLYLARFTQHAHKHTHTHTTITFLEPGVAKSVCIWGRSGVNLFSKRSGCFFNLEKSTLPIDWSGGKKLICVLKVWLNMSCEITVPVCQSYPLSFHHARWKAFECDSVQSNEFTHANLS